MSTEYYQKDKESLQKTLLKSIKIFQNKKKAKSEKMVINMKIFLKKRKTVISMNASTKKVRQLFFPGEYI